MLVRTLLLGALFLCGGLSAAPFAEWFDVKSPKGAAVRVWGEGDEFSAAFEAADGHTVLFDTALRAYVYARKDAATGALAATGIAVGDETPDERSALAGIPLHLRDTSSAAEDARRRRIEEDEEACGTRRRWGELKEQHRRRRDGAKAGGSASLMAASLTATTLGEVVGLTLLIDFPITNRYGVVTNTLAQTYHPDVTKDKLDQLLNGEDCTLWGNVSSVRKYYEDVSCGRLRYTNIVLGWFTAKYPREHYDDPTQSSGPSARELIGEVFDQMRADPSYATKYLPSLQRVSCSGSYFRALNVFFAGPSAPNWNMGLWAHKWSLTSTQYAKLPVSVGGATKYFYTYQISPVTSSPSIGTFCHENGHMVCGFPDLYSYSSAGRGVGNFCLMCSHGSTNPQYVCPYLRAIAGWVTPKTLPTVPGRVVVSNRLDNVWKYAKSGDSGQYFLVENRQRKGRDAGIGASGILVWRCDEKGVNSSAAYLSDSGLSGNAKYRRSNEVSLEQADGLYQIEQGKNYGDSKDAWYQGNLGSDGLCVFSDTTEPCARWRDGSTSGLLLAGFSAVGDVMTFQVGEIPREISLADALDNASLTFAIGGDVGWTGQSDVTHDGEDAARSGAIAHSQKSSFGTTVTGPGALSFWWKVSSESRFDKLRFYVDGIDAADAISGEADWAQVSCELGDGSHVLKWSYEKDGSVDKGEDCGWVDGVVWTRPSCTVTFDANGGTCSTASVTVVVGSAYGTLPTPTRPGYAFAGWFTAASGGTQVTGSTAAPSSARQTLYAHWTANTYYVRFVANGGSGTMPEEAFTYGTAKALTSNAFTRVDHVFAGWAASASGPAVYTDGQSVSNLSVAAGVTVPLYAVWRVESIPLEVALDNTELTFTDGGNAGWTGLGSVTHDGVDAARSGAVTHTQKSSFETTVKGPGMVSFWWKASSESGFDKLRFCVDGNDAVDSISGEADWAQVSCEVGSGSHVLKWSYEKDGSVDKGNDCGWVDQVVWNGLAHTTTTAVPVPHSWIGAHFPGTTDFEARAKAKAANGRDTVEACYVAGLDPRSAAAEFRAHVSIGDGLVRVGWTPDLNTGAVARIYTVLGCTDLGAEAWQPVRPWHRFFKVVVAMPTGADGEETAVSGAGFAPTGRPLGGVQLWEGGPFWAECNVGATKPEESGSYFWWGDTVGYAREGGSWVVDYGAYSNVTWVSSMGTRMGDSPFGSSCCPTHGKDGAQLLSAGYVDATGNLTGAHDAATAHLGAPWRMPTDAEMSALASKCTTTWTTYNGVYGRLMSGKGAFSTRSIFLPAAGYGGGAYLNSPGSEGYYRSSAPYSGNASYAWGLYFSNSGCFLRYYCSRYQGFTVRPLRDSAK